MSAPEKNRESTGLPKEAEKCHKIFNAYLENHGRSTVVDGARISLSTLLALRDWKFNWWDPKNNSSPKPASERVRRAWAKSLTRVANLVGGNPKDWIRAVGWEIDDSILEAINHEAKDLASNDGNGSLDSIRSTKKLRTAYVRYQPFGNFQQDNLHSNFYHRLLSRLLHSFIPDGKVSIMEIDLEEAHNVLQPDESHEADFDLIAGYMDLPSRRLNRVKFTPLRGWDITLDAIYLGSTNLPAESKPNWREIATPQTSPIKDSQNQNHALVAIPGESGHLYLKGTAGYSDPNNSKYQLLDYIPGEDPDTEKKLGFGSPDYLEEFSEALVFWSKAYSNSGSDWGQAIFVADVFTCINVQKILNSPQSRQKRSPKHKQCYRLSEDRDSKYFPNFPLGLATMSSESLDSSLADWSQFLAEACQNVTYGYDWMATASIYANQVVHLYLSVTERDIEASLPNFFKLKDDATTFAFWNEFAEEVQRIAPDQKDLLDEIDHRFKSKKPSQK